MTTTFVQHWQLLLLQTRFLVGNEGCEQQNGLKEATSRFCLGQFGSVSGIEPRELLGLFRRNKPADCLLLFPGLVWMLHQLSDQNGRVWVYSSLAVLRPFNYEDDEQPQHILSYCKPMAWCILKHHSALWTDTDLWILTQASRPQCQLLTQSFDGNICICMIFIQFIKIIIFSTTKQKQKIYLWSVNFVITLILS